MSEIKKQKKSSVSRRSVLKGSAAAAGVAVGSGAVAGFPTVWAQDKVTLRIVGSGVSMIEPWQKEAEKVLGMKIEMTALGFDGIQNKIHPGEAASKDLYNLPPEEDANIPTVARSLEEALEALNEDRDFLTQGGVFTDDFIDSFIDLKMDEVTTLRMTPHPVEFDLYYSV